MQEIGKFIQKIFGNFSSFLNWEEAYVWPQIWPRKNPCTDFSLALLETLKTGLVVSRPK